MLTDALPVGCGQCIPCRVNKRRVWTFRQILEAKCHEASSFVTLTYDDQHLDPEGNLSPRDFRLFLGRLRDRVGYGRFRYFGVGEYGDQTWRPHYHVNIFGLGPEYYPLVKSCWPFGFVSMYEFNDSRAQYCAGYVVKKMAQKGDWRLDGRTPEFARMSRNPGIGHPAARIIAASLFKGYGWDITKEKDVPKSLRHGSRIHSLGRYLRTVLREEVGMTDDWKEALKQEWVTQKEVEMQPMREAVSSGKALTTQEALVNSMLGSIWAVEGRSKLRRKDEI